MKKFACQIIWLMLLTSTLTPACKSNTIKIGGLKPLPPGQMKKIAGTPSAKPFAPGQQKKR